MNLKKFLEVEHIMDYLGVALDTNPDFIRLYQDNGIIRTYSLIPLSLRLLYTQIALLEGMFLYYS